MRYSLLLLNIYLAVAYVILCAPFAAKPRESTVGHYNTFYSTYPAINMYRHSAISLSSVAYAWTACMVEWVSSRATSSFITTHDSAGLGSNLGADTVNQAVHPYGVGKLVAVSRQYVTAVEYCAM